MASVPTIQDADGVTLYGHRYMEDIAAGAPPGSVIVNLASSGAGNTDEVAPEWERRLVYSVPPVDVATSPNIQPGGLAPLRMPKRLVWVALPEPYAGVFHVRAWANFSKKFLEKATAPTANLLAPDDPAIDPEAEGIDAEEAARRTAERARRTAAKDEADRQVAARLGEIIVAHDLHDEEGNPLPPASEPAFWEYLEDHELAKIIFNCIGAEVGNLTPPRRTR